MSLAFNTYKMSISLVAPETASTSPNFSSGKITVTRPLKRANIRLWLNVSEFSLLRYRYQYICVKLIWIYIWCSFVFTCYSFLSSHKFHVQWLIKNAFYLKCCLFEFGLWGREMFTILTLLWNYMIAIGRKCHLAVKCLFVYYNITMKVSRCSRQWLTRALQVNLK